MFRDKEREKEIPATVLHGQVGEGKEDRVQHS